MASPGYTLNLPLAWKLQVNVDCLLKVVQADESLVEGEQLKASLVFGVVERRRRLERKLRGKEELPKL